MDDCPHFTSEETEAQGHMVKKWGQGFRARSVYSKALTFPHTLPSSEAPGVGDPPDPHSSIPVGPDL